MDAVDEFIERFNVKELDAIRTLMGPGYTYAEPMFRSFAMPMPMSSS
jgi:hypothetical protein